MCCSEQAGTLAGGSRMRAGVHPHVVGAEAGSVFSTGLALPRREPGAEHTGSAWDPSSAASCCGTWSSGR